jgi:hypothetical protein
MNSLGRMLTLVGVNVLDKNGSYRNFESVIRDIGLKWNELNKEQQTIISNEFYEMIDG